MRSRPVWYGILSTLLAAGCSGSSGDPGSTGVSGGDGGPSAELSPEAGFIEVPGSSRLGPNEPARMFYSFLPAEQHADRAPVVLFFNGGPGAATTGTLMPYGTGPVTLDPEAPADAAPRANDAPYTRFANLLYVDARSTGFSYDIPGFDNPTCHGTERLYIADAADFIHVLLEFLGTHEALRDNPVVIAGESYGGTRAPAMLYMMQNYALESDDIEMMALAPPERWPSFRHLINYNAADEAESERDLRAALGALSDDDAYWLPLASPCIGYLGDARSLSAFADVLTRTATFITNARYDAAVYTEALPVFLTERSNFDVEVDTSLPAGAARPGVVRLIMSDSAEMSFRFPTYESGHEVSVGAPRELAEDVEAWLAETGAPAPR